MKAIYGGRYLLVLGAIHLLFVHVVNESFVAQLSINPSIVYAAQGIISVIQFPSGCKIFRIITNRYRKYVKEEIFTSIQRNINKCARYLHILCEMHESKNNN